MSYFESALGTGLAIGFGFAGMIVGGLSGAADNKQKAASSTTTDAFGRMAGGIVGGALWLAIPAYFAGDYFDGNQQPQQAAVIQPAVSQP